MPKKGGNSSKKGATAPKPSNSSASIGRNKGELTCSDDESQVDTMSIISSASENRSGVDEGEDELSQAEILEEKLKELIDLTTQKSSNGRVTSFESLCKAFSTKYFPDFVAGRRMTIMDSIERGLKKGKGSEQEVSAKLLVLLCLQLGSVSDCQEIYKEQKHILLTLMTDRSVSAAARAQCCCSLGLCCFLADCDLAETTQVMVALECIFSMNHRNSGGEGSAFSAETQHLHSAALSAWSLLLTVLPAQHIFKLSQIHVGGLVQLLDSTDVDVRIGAGEAIALIYEGARQFDEDFGFDTSSEGGEAIGPTLDQVDELCLKLKQLATDSNKYRAKKDRKQQRSSFRDILRGIEENESPELRVKFGRETLDIYSWSSKQQYDSLCQMLGSGMNLHLAQNELVREIFGLGAPLLHDDPANLNKIKKVERHHMNMITFKARTLARGKNRDKRTAVF